MCVAKHDMCAHTEATWRNHTRKEAGQQSPLQYTIPLAANARSAGNALFVHAHIHAGTTQKLRWECRTVVAADQVHVLRREGRRRRLIAVQRKLGQRLQGGGRRLGDGHPALGAARLQRGVSTSVDKWSHCVMQ